MTDKKPPFRLSKEHQQKALDIINANVIKKYKYKTCKWCNNCRLDHTDADGLIQPCYRCVDTYTARQQWFEYCKDYPELVDRFLKKDENDVSSDSK